MTSCVNAGMKDMGHGYTADAAANHPHLLSHPRRLCMASPTTLPPVPPLIDTFPCQEHLLGEVFLRGTSNDPRKGPAEDFLKGPGKGIYRVGQIN